MAPPRRRPSRKYDITFNLNTLPRRLEQLSPLSSPSAKQYETEVGIMRPPPLRRQQREDQYQEMVDAENPRKACEKRDAHFTERLPHINLLSRRLQSHLGINDPVVWPNPHSPDPEEAGNECFLERNTKLLQDALDDCKDYALKMDRETIKGQFLDSVIKERMFPHRARAQAGHGAAHAAVNVGATHNRDEVNESPIMCDTRNAHFKYTPTSSNARENKQKKQDSRNDPDHAHDVVSGDLPHTQNNALHDGPVTKQARVDALNHDRDEAISNHSSIPLPEHSGQFSAAPYEGLLGGSSARYNFDAAEAIIAAQITSGVSPARVLADASTQGMPHSSDSGVPTNSEEQVIPPQTHVHPSEQGRTQSEIDLHNVYIPESHDPWVEDGNDSIQGHEDRRYAHAITGMNLEPYYDSDGNCVNMCEWTLRYGLAIVKNDAEDEKRDDDEEEQNEDKEHVNDPDTSMVSPYETRSEGKRKARDHDLSFKDKLARIPQSKGMDYLGHIKETVAYKKRNYTPQAPQPQNMPGSLTQSLCHWYNFTASPLLTLTLEDVGASMSDPKPPRCVLLQHFEVGLDGIEAIIRGQVMVPETAAIKAERERRLQKLGTRRVADGGYYNTLKKVQEDMNHGKGYWCFWGVRFKQTKAEKKLKSPARWLSFGAPMEAIGHLAVPTSQQTTIVPLAGGLGRRGGPVGRYPAEMQRCQMLMCRGGVAPIDAWPGAFQWNDGLLSKVKTAMADNGLRLTFLFEDRMLSPATRTHRANECKIDAKVRERKGLRPETMVATILDASNIAEKRKAPSAMTANEEKEMGRIIEQAQKPNVGRMIANSIFQETGRQIAARQEPEGIMQDVRAPDDPMEDFATNKTWKMGSV